MRASVLACAALAFAGSAAAQPQPFAVIPAVKALCMEPKADPAKVAAAALAVGLKPVDETPNSFAWQGGDRKLTVTTGNSRTKMSDLGEVVLHTCTVTIWPAAESDQRDLQDALRRPSLPMPWSGMVMENFQGLAWREVSGNHPEWKAQSFREGGLRLMRYERLASGAGRFLYATVSKPDG
jgi:hypothetical protein